jgi:hypothetical protein
LCENCAVNPLTLRVSVIVPVAKFGSVDSSTVNVALGSETMVHVTLYGTPDDASGVTLATVEQVGGAMPLVA